MLLRFIARFTSCMAVVSLVSFSAHAQLFRTYVDSTGSDANPCSLTAPCRLLSAALAAVTSGGEVWMLDSANFNTGTVTINKSVSILAVPGVVGSLVATGGPALSIPATGIVVALRNLVIVPFPGSGSFNGIEMTGFSRLTIDHCLIANLQGDGVKLTGNGRVKIIESVLRDNTGYALSLNNGPTGEVAASHLLSNGAGVLVNTNVAAKFTGATIVDTNISGGFQTVFASAQGASAIAQINVVRSAINGTTYALDSETVGTGATALITVSGSAITSNGHGYFQSGTGAVIRSYGNNQFSENDSNSGVLATSGLQ
jgi:hypothetical protein